MALKSLASGVARWITRPWRRRRVVRLTERVVVRLTESGAERRVELSAADR